MTSDGNVEYGTEQLRHDVAVGVANAQGTVDAIKLIMIVTSAKNYRELSRGETQ